jgi:hypothetical protein
VKEFEANAYNPNTQKRQEDHEFKASLGYIARLLLLMMII